MNTRQQHGESERRESLGGRVRRFIDSELSRALDKKERGTDVSYTEDQQLHDRATETNRHHDTVDQGSIRDEEATPAPAHSRSTSEAAADGSATRVGLLNDPTGLRNEWQQVQGTFVDDPQRAVHEASVLVERTLQEIHENVSRGQISDPTSTEDLRVSFQRYREFFQRLLSA
jgi:hypothetical protein